MRNTLGGQKTRLLSLCLMGAMWKERRGGRWIWKKSYYCFSMQPVWRLKWLSNIIWAGNSQYFKIGWDWDQKWQRQEKERERRKGRRENKRAALRRSIIHQTPAASLFPPPPPERKRESEQQRESERVTLTRQRRRDVKRRIYKGKKSFSLFSFLSSCILRAARSGEEWRGPGLQIFHAASLQFLWLYHSAWSAGRAADSLIGDIAPQQKSTVEEPGCLTIWPTQRRGTGERKARVSDGMCHAVTQTHEQIRVNGGIHMTMQDMHIMYICPRDQADGE